MSFNKKYFGEGFFGNPIPDATVGVKDDEEILEVADTEEIVQAVENREAIVKVMEE